MNKEPRQWLPTSSGEHQVVVPKIPIVFYPFGRSAESESSSGDSGAPATPLTGHHVSVENPTIMHGRISAFAREDAAEAGQTEKGASSVDTDSPSPPFGHVHIQGPDSAQSPAVEADNNREGAVEPLSQTLAIALVRKHILGRGTDASKASAGRLVAERFSVGWVVYTPVSGRQRNTETYYVADDGELEETSSIVEPSAYLESVEQRFWQRRALFG
ncbi:hypothetical protein [Nocardia brevicatena]|uniref:hypothetical protein n=1 Tax=Nocardia brevicatena TaxID=37327 RepID=UPI0003162251|nr:hypothetical protein [Nocardia brevicatena]